MLRIITYFVDVRWTFDNNFEFRIDGTQTTYYFETT